MIAPLWESNNEHRSLVLQRQVTNWDWGTDHTQ